MNKPFVYEGALRIYENDGYVVMADQEELGRLIAAHFNPGDTSTYYPHADLPRVRVTVELIDELRQAEEDAFHRKDGYDS